jgi:hypothetical protein
MRTAVPKAAVHEDREARWTEYDIRSRGPAAEPQQSILPEAKPARVKRGPQAHLGFRIGTPVPAHDGRCSG